MSTTQLSGQTSHYIGVTGGEWATGSNWTEGNYPTTDEIAILNTTANLSINAPNNIEGIRIGTNKRQAQSEEDFTYTKFSHH